MLSDDIRLASAPSAVKWAYHFTGMTLQRWQLVDVYPEAPAIAAELTKTAIARLATLSIIRVGLWFPHEDRLQVEVWQPARHQAVDAAFKIGDHRAGYFYPPDGGTLTFCDLDAMPELPQRAPDTIPSPRPREPLPPHLGNTGPDFAWAAVAGGWVPHQFYLPTPP
jgi:hypothetical protein